MNAQTHQDITSFLAKTLPSLSANETANNLMLGIALRLKQDPNAYGDSVCLATVEQGQDLAAAALMTPPYNMILHCDPAYAAEETCMQAWSLLIGKILQEGWEVPGVIAHAQHAREFASLWQQITGESTHTALRMRAFELHEVSHPENVPGHMRRAEECDLQTVYDWWTAFNKEAVPHDPLPTEERTRKRIESGEIFLWIDGSPVSIAATTRSVGKGINIGLVYTPPGNRRRGYAGALVAALSQHFLDSGYATCTLFTDLANPTSNAIYQRIGYRPVCDYEMVRFGDE